MAVTNVLPLFEGARNQTALLFAGINNNIDRAYKAQRDTNQLALNTALGIRAIAREDADFEFRKKQFEFDTKKQSFYESAKMAELEARQAEQNMRLAEFKHRQLKDARVSSILSGDLAGADRVGQMMDQLIQQSFSELQSFSLPEQEPLTLDEDGNPLLPSPLAEGPSDDLFQTPTASSSPEFAESVLEGNPVFPEGPSIVQTPSQVSGTILRPNPTPTTGRKGFEDIETREEFDNIAAQVGMDRNDLWYQNNFKKTKAYQAEQERDAEERRYTLRDGLVGNINDIDANFKRYEQIGGYAPQLASAIRIGEQYRKAQENVEKAEKKYQEQLRATNSLNKAKEEFIAESIDNKISFDATLKIQEGASNLIGAESDVLQARAELAAAKAEYQDAYMETLGEKGRQAYVEMQETAGPPSPQVQQQAATTVEQDADNDVSSLLEATAEATPTGNLIRDTAADKARADELAKDVAANTGLQKVGQELGFDLDNPEDVDLLLGNSDQIANNEINKLGGEAFDVDSARVTVDDNELQQETIDRVNKALPQAVQDWSNFNEQDRSIVTTRIARELGGVNNRKPHERVINDLAITESNAKRGERLKFSNLSINDSVGNDVNEIKHGILFAAHVKQRRIENQLAGLDKSRITERKQLINKLPDEEPVVAQTGQPEVREQLPPQAPEPQTGTIPSVTDTPIEFQTNGDLPPAPKEIVDQSVGLFPDITEVKTLANNDSREKVVKTAKGWVGKQFKKGQTKRCADFVCSVFNSSGDVLNGFHTEGARILNSSRVGKQVSSVNSLQPGDVILFKNTYNASHGSPITHVGIVTEKGKFVHRRTFNSPVTEDSYLDGKWRKHFFGGRRPKYGNS